MTNGLSVSLVVIGSLNLYVILITWLNVPLPFHPHQEHAKVFLPLARSSPLLCVCHFKLKVDLFHIKVFLFLFPLLLISSCNSHFPLSQLTNDSDDDDEDDNVKCEKMLKSMSKRNEMGGGGNKGVLF